MLIPSSYVGTVVSERLADLGFVQPEGDGILLSAVNVRAGAAHAATPSDHWRMQFGTTLAGKFKSFDEIHFPKGVAATGQRVIFARQHSVARGALLTMKLAMIGQPEPLEDLFVTLEYVSMGSK